MPLVVNEKPRKIEEKYHDEEEESDDEYYQKKEKRGGLTESQELMLMLQQEEALAYAFFSSFPSFPSFPSFLLFPPPSSFSHYQIVYSMLQPDTKEARRGIEYGVHQFYAV